MKQELKVVGSRKEEFEGFVARINKKAAKLGLRGVSVTWGQVETVADTRRDPTGEKGLVLQLLSVTVDGDEPILAGWRFVAALDHLTGDNGEVANIVRCKPGEQLPEQYRTSGPNCDHCGHNRRRAKTYVLQHENGESCFKQVGSTCIGDFLGAGLNPELAAQYEEELFGLLGGGWGDDEGFGGGGGGERFLDLDQVLAVSVAQIRLYGWTSRAKARDDFRAVATAEQVMGWLCFDYARATERDRDAHRAEAPTDEDRARALASKEWAKSLAAKSALSDYEHNLVVLSQVGVITFKHLGLVASLPASHQRELGREVERRAAAAASKHFGTVGKRETWTLAVSRINTSDGNYGTTYIVGFVSPEGNQAMWFSSRNPGVEVGQTYRVKGTVKSHGDYKGVAQTVLTRCAVTELEQAPEAAPAA